MRAALTFDDGPSEWTPQILEILETYNVPATFFVCGEAIEGNEKILRRIKRRGHELGNHTMTHPDLQRSTPRQVFEELGDCSLAILEVTGVKPAVYRAPYLRDCDAARMVGEAFGMQSVGVDAMGFDWVETDYNKVAESVAGDMFDGAIALLHDGIPPRKEDGLRTRAHVVHALKALIPWLKDKRGYEFFTVSDLLFKREVEAVSTSSDVGIYVED